eukprot:PhM_4_TR2790/c0_g1_i1/m.37954
MIDLPNDFQPLEHIARVYASSECRTPLVATLEDGDPLPSVQYLAHRLKLTVWNIVMDTPKAEQNALDYLDVGFKNGDWVYLTVTPESSQDVFRQIALSLMTIQPEPKNFPKRELFRLWIVVDKHIDINQNINPRLPTLLSKHALVGMKLNPAEPSDAPNTTLRKKRVADPDQFVQEVAVREHRKEIGKDEDSESDLDEPEKKITGMWFHRSADLYIADNSSAITNVKEAIFDAIEKRSLERLREVLTVAATDATQMMDINDTWKNGMTPLMWAVMMADYPLTEALLASGGDPNLRAKGSGCPPLFMALDSTEMLTLLVKHGADLDSEYEGKRLVDHPETSPDIVKFIQQHPDL